MAPEPPERATDDQDDQDRVVSRRVDNPTRAEPGDEAVYRAARTTPDPEHAPDPAAPTSGTPGTSTTTAAAEMDAENESEPDRSE